MPGHSKEFVSYRRSTASIGCKIINTNSAFYIGGGKKKLTIGKTGHCNCKHKKTTTTLQCLLQGMILFPSCVMDKSCSLCTIIFCDSNSKHQLPYPYKLLKNTITSIQKRIELNETTRRCWRVVKSCKVGHFFVINGQVTGDIPNQRTVETGRLASVGCKIM